MKSSVMEVWIKGYRDTWMKLFWNLSSTPQNKLLDFYLRDLLAFEKRWNYFVTTEYQNGLGLIKEISRTKAPTSRLCVGRDGECALVPLSALWHRDRRPGAGGSGPSTSLRALFPWASHLTSETHCLIFFKRMWFISALRWPHLLWKLMNVLWELQSTIQMKGGNDGVQWKMFWILRILKWCYWPMFCIFFPIRGKFRS